MRAAVAVVIGAVLGALGARVLLVGSGLNLLVWAVVGAAIGGVARTPGEAWRTGALFGASVSLVFLVASYDGSAAAVPRTLFFVVLSAFGAACGAVLGRIGHLARGRRAAAHEGGG